MLLDRDDDTFDTRFVNLELLCFVVNAADFIIICAFNALTNFWCSFFNASNALSFSLFVDDDDATE